MRLAERLPDLFGYHAIQLGSTDIAHFLTSSRISHTSYINIDKQQQEHQAGLCCEIANLPLSSDTVDVVLLAHVLEFEPESHQVLREVERVLIGEGHIVIVGFNPWSLWGLWRLLLAWWKEPPWCGNFIGSRRIKDWLQLLGFDIVHSQSHFFRPPFRSGMILSKLKFFDKIGAFCCSFLGGFYIIIAKKRVETMTPVRQSWKARRQLISTGLAEPSTSNNPCNRQ